ncbi:MAG: hypothetical protein WC414_01715 [Patescibacteria group bacterium]
MNKKRIDWFLIFLLFLAVILFLIIGFFINEKLSIVNKQFSGMTEIKKDNDIFDSKVRDDYLEFLHDTENNLIKISEDKNMSEIFFTDLEEKIFSIKVPTEYRDYHLKIALLLTKIKMEMSNLENYQPDLVELQSLIRLKINN